MNTHRANRAITAPSPALPKPSPPWRLSVSINEIQHPRHRRSLSLTMKSSSGWLLCLLGPFILLGLPVYVQTSPVPSTHTSLVTPPAGMYSFPLTRLVPRHASSLLIEKRTAEAGAVAVPVTAVGRVGYAGNILIGNPPQTITVLFDTGSDLALVISDECQGDECADVTQFSCSSSSTCVDLGGDGNNRSGIKPITLDASSLGPEDVAGKVAGLNSNAGVESGRKADHDRKMKEGSAEYAHTEKENALTTRSVDNEVIAGQVMSTPLAARLVGPGVSKIEDRRPLTTSEHGNTGGRQGARSQLYSPWSRLYNQSYVDGSWGAGTFVQDRIQVDASPITDTSSPPSSAQEPSLARSATVTFLNVVQDNLGLARAYEGQVSGLLGLTRSSTTGRKTFLQELVHQGSLAMPIMSMRLDLQGGSFMLGGIDPTQYSGELIYSPVTDPVTWQLSLQGLATRSRTAHGTATASAAPHLLPQSNVFQDAALIIDSGTSSLLIPTAASEAIHGELSGTYDPIHRAWFLPCDGPDLVWWIGSGQYGVVQPYESLIYPLEDGRCQSLIFDNQEADYWILGDTWLRGLYLVFDMAGNGRIGIAKATTISSSTGAAMDDNDLTRILAYQDTSAGSRSHGGRRWTLVVISMLGVMLIQTTLGLFP